MNSVSLGGRLCLSRGAQLEGGDLNSGQFLVRVKSHVANQAGTQDEHDVKNHLAAKRKARCHINDRQDANDDGHAH